MTSMERPGCPEDALGDGSVGYARAIRESIAETDEGKPCEGEAGGKREDLGKQSDCEWRQQVIEIVAVGLVFLHPDRLLACLASSPPLSGRSRRIQGKPAQCQ